MSNQVISYCNSLNDCFADQMQFIVHSVFKNGLNLACGNRLIYVGNYQGPSGIVVSQEIIAKLIKLKQNDPVVYDNNNLLFKRRDFTFPLYIDKKLAIDYHMPKITLNKVAALDLFATILKRNDITGFEMTTSVFVAKSYHHFLEDTTDWLNYYFGRGMGLTPSGDDCITGLLVIHSISPFLPDSFEKELRCLISDKKTTDVSLNFLQNALDGLFSKDIISLMSHLNNQKQTEFFTDRIVQFGSTSGKDILSGIALAIAIKWRLL